MARFGRFDSDLYAYLVSPIHRSKGRKEKRSKSQRTIVDAILLRPQLGYITELRYN